MSIEFREDTWSNCPYKDSSFVVQAYDSLYGWMDTKAQAQTKQEAVRKAEELLADKSVWIGGVPSKVRIVKTKRR